MGAGEARSWRLSASVRGMAADLREVLPACCLRTAPHQGSRHHVMGHDLLQGPLSVVRRGHPRVSVAIPLYNEEQGVDELIRRVGNLLSTLPGGPHEMVLVNDGSRDRTLEKLEAAAARDSRIVVVGLSRNFGHQAALTAALDFVSGDVVVAMDGDLQDSPEAIPQMIARYEEGYDVVYVKRVQRKEGLALRLC